MNQLEQAKNGKITEEMMQVARYENIDADKLRQNIAEGKTVVVKSTKHSCKPLGIGKGLKIKVNSNIGTSNFSHDLNLELKKLKVSIKYGTDTVMDLSTGGDIDKVRKEIIGHSNVPIGTVPIYQAITEKNVSDITEQDFLDSIRKHIEDGVDFITVHCGLTKGCIPMLKHRLMGVVSRGGSFLVKWMLHHNRENPLYTNYDKIIGMAKKYDVTLSLGDGLRPGCLADATDKAQIQELKTLGELAKRAVKHNVQVMIEGPGHVPLDQIKKNIELEKRYCSEAPFYVLGPLVTDISPAYDHITGAIGGALAAYHGADFLCYLTPAEHLGLPDVAHVVEGVIASKIAAHAADIARGIKGARDIDDKMAEARSNLDWKAMYKLALNPEKARQLRKTKKDTCTMCGDFCSARINREEREKY
ncbi:phosphomethylpyrimidine synthase ThiC [Candidatus Woesearchaeota archaeon]|nr:phosphomethylpyrimidine synthase ThiC [Candidatus Woesearchaeota archaeon]